VVVALFFVTTTVVLQIALGRIFVMVAASECLLHNLRGGPWPRVQPDPQFQLAWAEGHEHTDKM
jgi:hypothetical protein